MIIGELSSLDFNNRTVRRGRNNQGANRGITKKKMIIDEKISLDDTVPSLTMN